MLAGEGAPRERLALARLAAEAQLTVLRVRGAQIRLLEDALAACSSPGPEGAAGGLAPMTGAAYLRVLPELIKFGRYAGEALSRRRRGLCIMKQEAALSFGGSLSSKHPRIAESRNEPTEN